MSAISEPPAQTGESLAPGGPGGEDQLPVPASPGPPGMEDLLGLRIPAALIDLAVLVGLFLVLSVATGGASWDQGFSFDLAGGALFLFLALALGTTSRLRRPSVRRWVSTCWICGSCARTAVDPRC